MSATSKSRRRLRLPAIDARVVGGIVLIAVSIVGGLRLTSGPEAATQVYVAVADLDAGHVLTAGDLTTAELRGNGTVLGGLARAGRSGPPLGRTLRVPLHRGGAVSLDAMGAGVAAGREITIPATPEHALGGEVRNGDRVDVFATFDKGTDASRTVTVARSATVHGVVRAEGLFGQHGGTLTALTLDVEPDAAIALAFATRNAELDVVRAHGDLNGGGLDRIAAGDVR